MWKCVNVGNVGNTGMWKCGNMGKCENDPGESVLFIKSFYLLKSIFTFFTFAH